VQRPHRYDAALGIGAVATIVAAAVSGIAPRAHVARADGGEPSARPVAASAARTVVGDFDGDGRADLAIGVRFEDVGSAVDAGAVNVIYGSGAGLSSAGNQLWTQDSPGLIGKAEAGDNFGTSVATGDFNGDGFADLAIGSAGESIGSASKAGAVSVIYGSASGLTSAGNQFWDFDSTGIIGRLGRNDQFGLSLTTGDFNGDGVADLAVGAPGNDISPSTNVGSVSVIYGSAAGLTSGGNQFWDQDSPGILGADAHNDFFGWALTAGDVDGDGFDDLAIGTPFDNPNNVIDAGSVNVIMGSAAGLTSTGNQQWTQDSTDVADAAEVGDLLGWDVAAGDFNGDGFADLAIGVPDEDLALSNQGAVNVLYGSAAGLSADGNQLWSQDVAGGAAHAGGGFGNALAAGDVDRDGRQDLAIGAADAPAGTVAGGGDVDVLLGTAGGLSGTGAQEWNQDTGSIADQAEPNDYFGADVALLDFNGDGAADLAVAVTFEDIGSISNAGAVNVIYGSTGGGLTDAGNQFWRQGAGGILDQAEAGDQFAYAVA
jgi:hypothetical protein